MFWWACAVLLVPPALPQRARDDDGTISEEDNGTARGSKRREVMQSQIKPRPVLLVGGILVLVDPRPREPNMPLSPKQLLKDAFSGESGESSGGAGIKRAVICIPPKGGSTSFLEWIFLLSKGET